MVLPLRELGRDDIATAGGKGANLGELTRAGFPVPSGFVLTTTAYDRYVDALGLRGDIVALLDQPEAEQRISELFTDPLPDDVRDPLLGAYRALVGDGPDAVAVRSSATAEDLAGASFAGQQETILDVRGEDALVRAVRACWASLWTQRAVAYRAHLGIDPGDVSLAVVVQQLVDADAAGIAFSINPANGRREQVALNAAWGLGEAVVGGLVDPDTLVVDKRTHVVRERTTGAKAVMTVRGAEGTHEEPVPGEQASRDVLTDAEAAALADLVVRIEDHYGSPQDVEWARADGAFFVLQARPITALPEPIGDAPTDWSVPKGSWYFRASIIEQLPDPLTPLFGSMVGDGVVAALKHLLRRFLGGERVRDEDVSFPIINGYPYYRYSTGGLLRITAQTFPAMAKLAGQGLEGAVRLWGEEFHPRYVALVEEADRVDPATTPATELIDWVQRLLDAGTSYYTSVQAVIPQSAMTEMTFSAAYRLVKGKDDPPASTFFVGYDSAPIRADKSVWDLARWAKQDEALAAWLRGDGSEDAVAAGVRAEWDARLTAHLDAFGHTIYNLDFVNPVPADDPTPVLDAVRFYLGDEAPSPYERQARLKANREVAARRFERLDPVRRRIVTKRLAKVGIYTPRRGTAWADSGRACPTIGRSLAEVGRRFVDAGLIDVPADVYWLTQDEVRAAATRLDEDAHAALVYDDEVERRKTVWRGQRSVQPPQMLPVTDARWLRAVMPAREGQTGSVLKGMGSSGGRVTAPARLIMSTDDFAAFRPGEVLVAAITTPAYTPLFAMAAGVVTDVGGPLSHSSIVAREYGIPAVLGTGVGTQRIRTGMLLTLDGDKGTVTLPEE